MSITTASATLPKGMHLTALGRGSAWLCSLAVSLLFLLAPALWNGFAIVFHDTGGYIDRITHMDLGYGRSFFYGLFLWLSSLGWWSFWGPVTVQALAVIWIIRLLLRSHGLTSGPITTAAFAAVLASFTGVSWYAAQLLPDILVPLAVLALYLLGFCWQQLSAAERLPLVAIALLGMLSHMSCLALGIGLSATLVLMKISAPRWLFFQRVRILPPVTTVTTALLLMPLVHFLLVGKAGYTPGGPAFLFGRLVQDGLAQKYLAEHCPIEGVKLCQLQHRLPKTADEFLWGNSPFKEIGDWKGSEKELSYLVREIIRTYPVETVRHSLVFAAQQLVLVGTGDGLDEYHHHARGVFAGLSENVAERYQEARQQQDQVIQALFDNLNRVHVPVALLSMLGLAPVIVWGIKRKEYDVTGLATFVFVSLFGNAFICGALSNPHDRYQSRLVWIATLVMLMAALRHLRAGKGRRYPFTPPSGSLLPPLSFPGRAAGSAPLRRPSMPGERDAGAPRRSRPPAVRAQGQRTRRISPGCRDSASASSRFAPG